MEQVSENIYVETNFRGCVVSFIETDEGIVMIDSPILPSEALGWRDAVLSKGEVLYLVATDHHPDHITGTHFFPGTIISTEETRKEVLSTRAEDLIERVGSIDPEEQRLLNEHHYKVKNPGITFSDRLSLHPGELSIELLHMPGHTAGQCVVYLPEKRVLISGDCVFHKEQVWFHDSEPFKWLKSLERIQEMDIDVIVPGHGQICEKSYISELFHFILEWLDTVKKAIDKGLSREEAMEKISFLDRYPMQQEIERLGPEVQKWNVGRLYDLMKK